jgi:hypothetical protein
MDDEAIKWQNCAICGEQRQRIIREDTRPDFATCDSCKSSFVLEDGGEFRMLYAKIPSALPETKEFAQKKWRTYFEVRAAAVRERTGDLPDELPSQLKSTAEDAIHGAFAKNDDAFMALEAEQSDIFYSHAKKTEPPPRKLAETGELPNIDDLFEAFEQKKKDDESDS